jgi:hypothetical protein
MEAKHHKNQLEVLKSLDMHRMFLMVNLKEIQACMMSDLKEKI